MSNKLDFKTMPKEEKFKYLKRWSHYQEEVAAAIAAAMQHRFEIDFRTINFEAPLAEVTNNDETLTAHMMMDVHDILTLEVPGIVLNPYQNFDSLHDYLLLISSELTNQELGYASKLTEYFEEE